MLVKFWPHASTSALVGIAIDFQHRPALLPIYTGTVLGTVRDASNAPLPSASVVIEEIREGINIITRSSDAGSYEFCRSQLDDTKSA